MNKRFFYAIFLVLSLFAPATYADNNTLQTGPWYVFMITPGGRLPFTMEIGGSPGHFTAAVLNGDERVEIPIVTVENEHVIFEFDYYDSRIQAQIYDDGRSFTGTWSKTRGPDDVPSLQLWGYAGQRPRFRPIDDLNASIAQKTIDNIWRVHFKESDGQSIAKFFVDDEGIVTGTFQTPTGDYGDLEGVFFGGTLELSRFDGAHAFLFRARIGSRKVQSEDGPHQAKTLSGSFWSGNWWREEWEAVEDAYAIPPDGTTQIEVSNMIPLDEIHFPDLDGNDRFLSDDAFKGRCRIIEIFGSWCPNCHDASVLLKELHEEYADDGLSILALAFEATGDFERDSKQLKTYINRFDLPYPVLLAGQAKKSEASKKLPFLNELKAYPTILVTNELGGVILSYSGFNGPATGDDYIKLRTLLMTTVRQVLGIH